VVFAVDSLLFPCFGSILLDLVVFSRFSDSSVTLSVVAGEEEVAEGLFQKRKKPDGAVL